MCLTYIASEFSLSESYDVRTVVVGLRVFEQIIDSLAYFDNRKRVLHIRLLSFYLVDLLSTVKLR